MRHVLGLCAATILAGTFGCGSGRLVPPTDGSADRRDAFGDVAVDAGPPDLRQASADGRDARDGLDSADGPDDAPDGPDDTPDGPDDAAVADGMSDAIADGVDAADAGEDAPSSDAGMEAGRPYVERDCTGTDACVCASSESCSFSCPGGDCAITCAAGSVCTVTCAAPFGCSVSCGNDAQCILACSLGVCAHFSGPAGSLACDPGGTGCL